MYPLWHVMIMLIIAGALGYAVAMFRVTRKESRRG